MPYVNHTASTVFNRDKKLVRFKTVKNLILNKGIYQPNSIHISFKTVISAKKTISLEIDYKNLKTITII